MRRAWSSRRVLLPGPRGRPSGGGRSPSQDLVFVLITVAARIGGRAPASGALDRMPRFPQSVGHFARGGMEGELRAYRLRRTLPYGRGSDWGRARQQAEPLIGCRGFRRALATLPV